MQQQRFGLAQCLGQAAIAFSLPRLLLQRLRLGFDLGQNFVEPLQIGFSGFQLQIRLVTARVQPGDAGCVFENAAAIFGLGRDKLADLALPHQGGRVRAGRCVGEQQLHVLGADLAAIDAVGRAKPAANAAGDFEDLVLVVTAAGARPAASVIRGSLRHVRAPAGPPSRRR